MAEGSQQSRQFDATPGRYSDVGTTASAPSVNTTPYKVTPARFTNSGQAMAAIGSALGSFFNTTANAIQRVGEIDAEVERHKIAQENEDLRLQGGIDQKAGRPQNEAYANRRAYADAFQQSAADNHAAELTEEFKGVLAGLPRDGSQDPQAAAEAFWKDKVGGGTGDTQFDARLMSAFKRNADQLIAGANNQRLDDQDRVATHGIIQAQAWKLQSQNGFTLGDAASMRGDFLKVAHGDPVKADKLFSSVIATAQNQRQALSLLNGLETLQVGTDAEGKPITWAQQNAEAYNRMSQEALGRVTQVKSIQAYNEVSRWRARADELKVNPRATVQDWVALWGQGADIDARHGTGTSPFDGLMGDMRAFMKQTANANRYEMALNGTLNGSHFGGDYEKANGGKGMTETEIETGMASFVRNRPGMEALAASAEQTGYLNPQYNDESMLQFSRLMASTENQQASQGAMAPASLKQKAYGALLGRDVKQGARAFRGVLELERLGVTDAMLSKYLPSPEHETTYRALKSLSADGQDIESILTQLNDQPNMRAAMAKGQSSGAWNLPQAAGKHGTEAAEFQKKIDQGAMKLARVGSDRQNSLWFNKDVGMNGEVRSTFEGLLMKDFLVQQSATGAIDLDKALKNVGETMVGRFVTIPSMDGKLQWVPNTFGTRGQAVSDPLNADPRSPISTAKGYPPVYAGIPMKNAMGQREDPQVLMGQDMEALAKAMPSAFPDAKNVWTNRPDDQGLMLIKQRGQPIQFQPGQGIDMPTTVTTPDKWTGVGTYEAPAVKRETVPQDPQEAAKFFQRLLPPGFIATQSGQNGAWQLHYGFRLLGTAERAAASAKTAEAAIDQRNATSANRTEFLQGTTTEGGAAIRYRKPF